MKKKKTALSYTVISIVCVLLLAADQITKKLIDERLPAGGIDVIKNYFAIEKVYNTGAAWGTFSNATAILSVISILMAAALLFAYVQADPNLVRLALGLLVSGAVGNVIDRIRLGYVIDFLSFYNTFGYSFPVFNVADICVTGGTIGILIYLVFLSRKKKMFREGTPLSRLFSDKSSGKGNEKTDNDGCGANAGPATESGENIALEQQISGCENADSGSRKDAPYEQ